MQKILAIALIIVHLFGNTELGQVFKLPKLFSHYFQHHRQNPDINFLDFIAMHYGGDDGTTADDDIDSQLPYHNIDYNCLFSVYSPMVQEEFSVIEIDFINITFGGRLHNGNPSKHVRLILQPPKAA